MKYFLPLAAIAAITLSACQKSADTPVIPAAAVIEVPVAILPAAEDATKTGAQEAPEATDTTGTAGNTEAQGKQKNPGEIIISVSKSK